MKRKLDDFTTAYIEAALWASTDNSDDTGGEPLDKNYSPGDIADETINRMIQDCKDFQEQHAELLAKANYGKQWDDMVIAGHDFWLTRNHHGAGFWDGDLSDDIANSLTAAARAFGEYDLYINDGLIYGSPS